MKAKPLTPRFSQIQAYVVRLCLETELPQRAERGLMMGIAVSFLVFLSFI